MIDIPWMACTIPLLTIIWEREILVSATKPLLCHVMLTIIIVCMVSSECYFGKMENSECLAINDW